MPNTTPGSDSLVTHWTKMINPAKAGSDEALNWLFTRYRPILIPWVQSRFHTNFHDAEDLVQGFAASLLRRDFLKNVDRSKGKFRTFLFTSLYNYVVSEFRKRKLPMPISLEQFTEEGGELPPEATEELWVIWTRLVLKNAWSRLLEEAAAQDRAALCNALEPVLYADKDKLSYARIAKQLDMSEVAVKTAACRLRDRFRRLIRAEVRETVANKPDLEEELSYLLKVVKRTEKVDPAA